MIVAVVNGNLTIKYLRIRQGKAALVADHPYYADRTSADGEELVICGAVTRVLHRVALRGAIAHAAIQALAKSENPYPDEMERQRQALVSLLAKAMQEQGNDWDDVVVGMYAKFEYIEQAYCEALYV